MKPLHKVLVKDLRTDDDERSFQKTYKQRLVLKWARTILRSSVRYHYLPTAGTVAGTYVRVMILILSFHTLLLPVL